MALRPSQQTIQYDAQHAQRNDPIQFEKNLLMHLHPTLSLQPSSQVLYTKNREQFNQNKFRIQLINAKAKAGHRMRLKAAIAGKKQQVQQQQPPQQQANTEPSKLATSENGNTNESNANASGFSKIANTFPLRFKLLSAVADARQKLDMSHAVPIPTLDFVKDNIPPNTTGLVRTVKFEAGAENNKLYITLNIYATPIKPRFGILPILNAQNLVEYEGMLARGKVPGTSIGGSKLT